LAYHGFPLPAKVVLGRLAAVKTNQEKKCQSTSYDTTVKISRLFRERETQMHWVFSPF